MTLAEDCGVPSWWRYVVLAATFYMNFIINGYAYTYGLLKIPLGQEYPDANPMLLSSIGGVISGLYMGTGPIAIACAEAFGTRYTTWAASLVATACLIISWLNNQFFNAGVYLDLFTLGIIQGIALGFLYGPSIAILPTYFPLDQIAFASGAANAGSSLGIIVYGAMVNPLFNTFGWRGTMLIYAMFSLHGVLAGFAFVNLETYLEGKRRARKRKLEKKTKEKEKEAIETAHKKDDQTNGSTTEGVEIVNEDKNTDNVQETETVNEDVSKTQSAEIASGSAKEDEAKGDVEANKPKEDPLNDDEKPLPVLKKETFMDVMRRFLDPELFKQWAFIVALLAGILSIIGYYIPTLLIPSQAKNPKYGAHKEVAENIIVIFGVLNLTGRFVLGKLGDYGHKYVVCSSIFIYTGSMTTCALILFIFPHLLEYGDGIFIALIVLYGFCCAPIITFRNVYLINLFGKSNASASYGWFLFAQISQLIGYILCAFLEAGYGPPVSYGFAGATFALGAIACASTAKPFFAARRIQIQQIAQENAAKEAEEAKNK